MPTGKWKTVSLRKARLDDLEVVYDEDTKRPRTQEFGAWLDSVLYNFVHFSQELKKFGPFLSVMSVSKTMINLYDHMSDMPVSIDIDVKSKKLKCRVHKKFDCIHVGYCYAIPEIYDALISVGMTPPGTPDPSGIYVNAGNNADSTKLEGVIVEGYVKTSNEVKAEGVMETWEESINKLNKRTLDEATKKKSKSKTETADVR